MANAMSTTTNAGPRLATAAGSAHSTSYAGLVFRQFLRNRAAVVAGIVLIIIGLVALAGPLFLEDNRYQMDLRSRLLPSSWDHPLGTDLLGRDMLTRLVQGGRISLLITSGAVALALIVGATMGIVAGYYGRTVDLVVMRVIDVLMTMPGFLLAIAIIAALGVGTVNVVLAVGIFSIPAFARIARGSTLSVGAQDYVLAAKALGAPASRVMLRHVLPNIVPPLIVQTTLRLATAMLTASSLSFLGLGPQPPTPEWGAMLADGRDFITNAPQLVFYPGLTILIVAMSFNMVGDGLRDALDPYLRR
ncbi:MAG: ABC transporter permease [Thermomicrobiales bacterium]